MSQIRKASPADNIPARDLVRRSLAAYGIEVEFDGLDHAIGSFGTQHSRNVVELVAELNGALVGCLTIQSVGNAVGKMSGFHVKAELRGKGIGRSLLMEAISETRNLGFTILKLDTWGRMNAAV